MTEKCEIIIYKLPAEECCIFLFDFYNFIEYNVKGKTLYLILLMALYDFQKNNTAQPIKPLRR